MDDLAYYLRRDWWIFATRGTVAIAFGIATFVGPVLTLAVLTILFGAYVLIDGAFGLVYAIRNFSRLEHGWLLVFSGALGILVGLLALFAPGMTAAILLALIAVWAIIRGVLQISAAIVLRHEISGEGWLIASGALSVMFGILLFVLPEAGILSVTWLIGFYAVLFGTLLIGLAQSLRETRGKISLG